MVPSPQGCSSVIFVGLTFHVRVDVVCVWPAAARVSESQSNQLFSCLQCLLLGGGGGGGAGGGGGYNWRTADAILCTTLM